MSNRNPTEQLGSAKWGSERSPPCKAFLVRLQVSARDFSTTLFFHHHHHHHFYPTVTRVSLHHTFVPAEQIAFNIRLIIQSFHSFRFISIAIAIGIAALGNALPTWPHRETRNEKRKKTQQDSTDTKSTIAPARYAASWGPTARNSFYDSSASLDPGDPA